MFLWIQNAKRIATTKVGNGEESGSDHDGLHWDSDEEINMRQKSPKGGSIFELIPDLEKHLQEHQREGFRFLWRNLAGVDPGGNPCVPPMEPGGCVLSHAPGTGKSLLIISFLQSYMKVSIANPTDSFNILENLILFLLSSIRVTLEPHLICLSVGSMLIGLCS